MTTDFLVLTRAIHFGACLLFFGIFAFDRFVATSVPSSSQSEITGFWKSRLKIFSLFVLPVIFLSGVAWFALVAMTMSGQPLSIEIMKIVWTQTQFGTVWKIRLIFWLAAIIAFAFFYFSKPRAAFQKILIWLQLILGGGLLGGLAWAGHGQEDSRWHLFADILHLLAAGCWPTGLLPLFLLLRKSRQISESTNWISTAALVRRFSALSLGVVALLAATGFVNGWFLVGSFSNLVGQIYGRWLLAKIIFFVAAISIGAVNLLRLKPRLMIESAQLKNAGATVGQLQFNVRLELFLGTAIVIVVAVLGILPPASH